MKLNRGEKALCLAAGILSIIEGCISLVLSGVCIVLFAIDHGDFVERRPSSFTRAWLQEAYVDLIHRDASSPLDGGSPLTPLAFHMYMWAYCVLSAFWIVAAGCLISTAASGRARPLAAALACWGGITCLVSIIDFALSALVIISYATCESRSSDDSDGGRSHIDFQRRRWEVAFPLLVATSRGFVLWLVNVALAGVAMGLFRKHAARHRRRSKAERGAGDSTRVYTVTTLKAF